MLLVTVASCVHVSHGRAFCFSRVRVCCAEWAEGGSGEASAAAGGERGVARSSREDPGVGSGGVGALTHDATDRRLRRLAEGRRRHVADAEILEGGDEADEGKRYARHGGSDEEEEEEERAVAVKQEEEDGGDDSEDEDKLEERRARVRALALARRAQQEGEEEQMMAEEEVEDQVKGESSDSWEYETDSDEEEAHRLVKPAFVPKAARATLDERERRECEEEEESKMRLLRAEQRKLETRKIVAEEVAREKQVLPAVGGWGLGVGGWSLRVWGIWSVGRTLWWYLCMKPMAARSLCPLPDTAFSAITCR
jgi:hypothetical protein